MYLIDNTEDLDVVMLKYNLIKCSKNYRKTTVSLWNYYRDEPNNLNDDDSRTVNYNTYVTTNFKSFKYKSSITGKKSQMQIKKMVKTLSKEIQRLKKSLNCCAIKTFKQFLESIKHATY